MKKIQPITTIADLYKTHGEETGEIIVDATVYAIMHSTTREAGTIAEMVGADRRKLTMALELLVGIPLKDMIDEWRMLQARDLCLDESIALEDVPSKCGFASYKGFAQAVLKRWSTTPYTLRNGRVIPNGNYSMNRNPEQRRKVEDCAKELRQEKGCSTDQQR